MFAATPCETGLSAFTRTTAGFGNQIGDHEHQTSTNHSSKRQVNKISFIAKDNNDQLIIVILSGPA